LLLKLRLRRFFQRLLCKPMLQSMLTKASQPCLCAHKARRLQESTSLAAVFPKLMTQIDRIDLAHPRENAGVIRDPLRFASLKHSQQISDQDDQQNRAKTDAGATAVTPATVPVVATAPA
jgi:hypothetical protein